MYLWKQQYRRQFNLNYPIKKTYCPSSRYLFFAQYKNKNKNIRTQQLNFGKFLPKTQQY